MIRLHFTTGRGPAECRIALRLALERLQQEADKQGVDCDVSTLAVNEHGPASALAQLTSHMDPSTAERLASNWTGSLLWVCPSAVRTGHKRKNWFIGATRLQPSIDTPKALRQDEVQFSAMRAGGPGGQHQNKTQSAVRATHLPTGKSVVVRDGRSQHQNKSVALQRLAAMIASDAELAALADAERQQKHHNGLERGRPTRTFRGPDFESD